MFNKSSSETQSAPEISGALCDDYAVNVFPLREFAKSHLVSTFSSLPHSGYCKNFQTPICQAHM
jgi:hypothetical protein